MRHQAAALASVLASALIPWLAIPAHAAPDPVALMRAVAAEPYRYGGSLQGTVPGAARAIDRSPVHLSIGLAAPDAQGRLQGDAILFDQGRRLVSFGHVVGQFRAGPTAGTGSSTCTLRLSLPAAEVTLAGACTDTTLSGEIVSQPHPADLLTRLISWWGDDAVAGRYWLTQASFDPQP